MIIVLRPGVTDKEIQHVIDRIKDLGLEVNVSRGIHRTVIGVIGEEDVLRLTPLEAMPGVEKVMPVLAPYKLASREFQLEDTIIRVKDAQIGGGTFTVMAGPCAVESREMLLEIAIAVKRAGATVLRGGAFKPRTSPYSFQGLGEEGLKLLKEASERTGLPVATEVMDTREVPLVAEYVDILQIGARNMQNFSLLNEVGKTDKPIILKRGLSATVKELLMSAEYILSQGNHQVILCERGVKSFEDSVRFVLDISAIPNVKGISHLPILVDPSHSTGRWDLVGPVSRAAVAVGADGLLVEVHNCPEKALSDGAQSLLPEKFRSMMDDLRRLAKVMNRTMARASES